MKKNYFTLILLAAFPLMGWSQAMITPQKNVVDQKWITNQNYKMAWTMVRDTIKMTIGFFDTRVKVAGDKITVITEVKMKSLPGTWIDSTVVQKKDLSPLYHSSYNAQRDMIIHFGKEITGFYQDKATGKTEKIDQTVAPGYFDSNFYPMLINWLPLKTGFSADMLIYDYNPKGKMGIVKAHILAVSEGKYQSKKLGERKVWNVTVADELSSAPAGKSIYQIDQLTRQLYNQKISAGSRTMEMTLVED